MTVRPFNTVVAAPILTKLRKDCATPLPVLRHVADSMAADMRAGLAADGGSDLKMILSYADALPTGYINILYINMCVCVCVLLYLLREFSLFVLLCNAESLHIILLLVELLGMMI